MVGAAAVGMVRLVVALRLGEGGSTVIAWFTPCWLEVIVVNDGVDDRLPLFKNRNPLSKLLAIPPAPFDLGDPPELTERLPRVPGNKPSCSAAISPNRDNTLVEFSSRLSSIRPRCTRLFVRVFKTMS